MAVEHKRLVDFQRHVLIDLSKLKEAEESYFFNLNEDDDWSRMVLREINDHFLQGIGAHLVFARWIPQDLSFTRGRWAEHLPLIMNQKISDKVYSLNSILLYGLHNSVRSVRDRFTLTDFILRELPKKIIITVVISENGNIHADYDANNAILRLNLPESYLSKFDASLSTVMTSLVAVTGLTYDTSNKGLAYSDFRKIATEGENYFVQNQQEPIGQLSNGLEDLSNKIGDKLKPELNRIKDQIDEELVREFCFTTLKLCLLGRPKEPIKQISMFSFPHYVYEEDDQAEKHEHQRSLCCFFLYTTSKIEPSEEERLREGLAYVSSVVAGAEYTRLVQEAILRGGTTAAVTALSGRNLSHNSGSHVIQWLESDARRNARSLRERINNLPDGDLKAHLTQLTHYHASEELSYRYLREKMDVVAAAAIHLPTWTRAMTVRELIADLDPCESLGYRETTNKKDSLFLRHIGHSEGVLLTDVVLWGGSERTVAVPGSSLGKQAFYGILENIARDSAKYGDLKTDAIFLLHDVENKDVTEYFDKDSPIKVIHLGKNSGFQKIKDIIKDGNQRRILAIEFQRTKQFCNARRDLQSEEKFSNSSVIYWKIEVSSSCNHDLCKLVADSEEGLEKMLKERDKGKIFKKALELDQALLSLMVEVSELEYSDVAQEMKGMYSTLNAEQDNLLRLRVWDDRTSYERSGKDINAALEILERDGLTDEEGRLRPGDWGVKERYIFAAYLRGEKPENWLLPEKFRETKSAIPPILRVIASPSDRMIWQFYVLKPKDILIVSNSETQEQVPSDKSDKINVWSWEDFRKRMNSSSLRHNFVILCPENENRIDKRELSSLSYRVFFCPPRNRQLGLPQGYPVLEDFDVKTIDAEQLFELWINFLETTFSRKAPKIVSRAKQNFFVEVSGEMRSDNSFDLTRQNNIALFDRHGEYINEVMKHYKDGVVHYEPFQGGEPVAFRADFSVEVQRRNYRKSTRSSLQEAALTRVLLVDERMDDSIEQFRYRFSGKRSPLEISGRKLWEFKGVDVIGRKYRGKPDQIPDEKPILDKLQEGTTSGRPYGLLVVHQGILDKLYKKHRAKESKKVFIDGLLGKLQSEGNVWHVLVHSGRGGIPELPEDIKFIHLSNIETWFASNLSKAEVVEELMSVH